MALNRERLQEDSSRTLPIQIDLTEIKLIIDKKMSGIQDDAPGYPQDLFRCCACDSTFFIAEPFILKHWRPNESDQGSGHCGDQ